MRENITVKADSPKISFGIIVLNGEPFTRYNLRNIYEFAYEIIIAEGASLKATHIANSEGHSTDGTLEILREFKAKEDPENKITIVTAEDEGYPNGFWPGEKDEQSQAYAKRCTGDFLWQLDIDEFYDKADIAKIAGLLSKTKKDTCFTVAAHNYFLSPQIKQVGSYFNHPCFQGEPWGRFRRIFSWGEGYQYVSHRPPTVANAYGKIIHKRRKVDISSNLGVLMHHYSVFSVEKWQAKIQYYKNQKWSYDKRKGLSQNELLKQYNWKHISNQYNTFNTLKGTQSTIQILDEIYRENANHETKNSVEAILKEFSNVSFTSKIIFLILSVSDSIFRNVIHPLKKIGSRIFSYCERLLFSLGIRKSINKLRQRSNQLN